MATNFSNRAYETKLTSVYQQIVSLASNTAAFKEKLELLLPTIDLDNPKPLSKESKFIELGTISDPIVFSEDLKKLGLDLELLFSETEIIDEYLNTVEASINDDIYERYALLLDRVTAQIGYFQNAIANNQKEAQTVINNLDNPTLRTTRLERPDLFRDPNGNEYKDLSIQSSIGLLTLPWSQKPVLYKDAIAKIRLSESEVSEVEINSSQDIYNILNGVGWDSDILKIEPLIDGCRLAVEVQFNEVHTINFVSFKPFAYGSQYLTDIKYEDSNGNLNSVVSLVDFPILLNRNRQLYFTTVSTNKIVIYLKQYKGELISLAGEGSNPQYFHYSVGLSDLQIGLQKYEDSGVFIGEPIQIAKLGSIKYYDKRIPVRESFIQTVLYIENFDDKDNLLSSHKIYIPKDGIVNEDLGLNQDNTGQTQTPIDENYPLSVRLNGSILPSAATQRDTGRINFPSNLLYSKRDKIIATYKPGYVNTTSVISTDASEKFKFAPDGTILIDRRKLEPSYRYSKIYPILIISSFTATAEVTPGIDYYVIELNAYSNELGFTSGTSKTVKTKVNNALQ